jgi:hypothetical protein
MTLALDDVKTLEPACTSFFVKCVGVNAENAHTLDVDGGEEEFTIGDVVTGAGGATGVIVDITDLAGVWDDVTSTGSCTLVLKEQSGTFVADEAITGIVSGVAVVVAEETAVTFYNAPVPPNYVKRLHIEVNVGTDNFTIGDTITGTTSTRFGTLEEILYHEGDWSTDGTCTLVLSAANGIGWQVGEEITGAISGAAELANIPETVATGSWPSGVLAVTGSGPGADPGLLSVTLDRAHRGLLMLKTGVVDTAGTADDWQIIPKSEDVDGTGEIVVQVFKGGGVSHPVSTLTLMFEVIVADSSMMPVSF